MSPLAFCIKIKVRHHELDTLGHLNNAVYLNYLEQVAIEHSDSLGFTQARYKTLGGMFVLRKMEIEYLRPAFSGEAVQVFTWAIDMQSVRATRGYEIQNENGEVLVQALGLWVWVDAHTNKASRIPEELKKGFKGALTQLKTTD